jgi:hypothetical protein
MNEIPPNTIASEVYPSDMLMYLKSLNCHIEKFDNDVLIFLKDENGKQVGKLSYVIYKSILQGKQYILKSYELKSIEENLNRYRTKDSPIGIINNYFKEKII